MPLGRERGVAARGDVDLLGADDEGLRVMADRALASGNEVEDGLGVDGGARVVVQMQVSIDDRAGVEADGTYRFKDLGSGTWSVKASLYERVAQRTVELGPEGASTEGPGGQWSYGFLANRCLTIAGGTSEVQRNVIAERLLGLPRDP